MNIIITALPGVPLVRPGDDLAALAADALRRAALRPRHGDVLVLAQKIVSKAEGRQVALASVVPGKRALDLARVTGKDARLVELILSESSDVVRARPGVLIVRHRLGLVLANAGIDHSNILATDDPAGGPTDDPTGDPADEQVLLLPLDPDASAERLRRALRRHLGVDVAVMIIDSLGRAWRLGTVGIAIGVAGMPAFLDLRGRPDLNGRTLESSELGYADELAAAASMAMGQANEARPMVLIQGLPEPGGEGRAADLVRPRALDLFP